MPANRTRGRQGSGYVPSGRKRPKDRNRNGVPDNLEGPNSPRVGAPGNAPGGGINSPRPGGRPSTRMPPATTLPGTGTTTSAPSNPVTGGGGLGSGGTGGAANVLPTNPLVGQDVRAANTPFGQRYDNLNVMGKDLFSNPDTLADSYLDMLGINPMTSGGMSKVYEDFAQALPQLWLITQGMGSMGANGMGAPDFANFVDYAGNALSGAGFPGASVLDPAAVGRAIFGAPTDSATYGFLNNPNADTGQQVSSLLGLLGGGLENSLPAPVLAAIMGQAQHAGRMFLDQHARNATPTNGTFADFLRNTTGLDEMLGYR